MLLKVLHIHWGFSIGGVAKYAATINEVSFRAPIEMRSVCKIGRAHV